MLPSCRVHRLFLPGVEQGITVTSQVPILTQNANPSIPSQGFHPPVLVLNNPSGSTLSATALASALLAGFNLAK